MIGSDAPRVHIAASSAIVVGLAALALKVSSPTPRSPPSDAPSTNLPTIDDARFQAIAYAEDVLECLDRDCTVDFGFPLRAEPIEDPHAPLSVSVRVMVVGQLDEKVLERRVEHSVGELRACYEHAIGPGGPLGTVTALIANEAAGARGDGDGTFITDATGITDGLAGCVAHTLRAIEFPPVKSATVATVQITFGRWQLPLTEAEEQRCDLIRELPTSAQIDFDPTFFKRCGPRYRTLFPPRWYSLPICGGIRD